MNSRILERLAEELREGRSAILVSVVEWRGSVPRKDKPCMLFMQEGDRMGSVGGGCVDGSAYELARRAWELGVPLRETLRLDAEAGSEAGLLCGGELEFEGERFMPEQLPRVEQWLAEPAEQAAKLLIFGGGHVGKSLAEFAWKIGFEIRVLDDRKEYSNPERFPYAKSCLVGKPEAAEQWPSPGPEDSVVIATRGHRYDEKALDWACRTKAGYIGMLSSGRKRDLIVKSLKEKGAPVESLKGRFHAPVGLMIGAMSSDEIALAIAAQLMEERSRRTGAEKTPG
ncbi:MAG: XdhC/CoxI family protein [Candidatus Krumholzibacteria bacterium]|jgi:xanthine dehydrogenase accessory factor|nr:XdhC/CoxI family protein [Candidatus Krumholzibacteria bacterium]MDP6669634.1 XdhC/CoxI family protein [Candidatus Krumholzibacteria bacterium]MDP6797073.1 XdhC/CoxI family protein [Candidatus Krumholzibacteria bacterium]